MLTRILEPEVMDSVAEAENYNAMDHSAVNRAFVDDFLVALERTSPPTGPRWRIFDAGTGTALIPIELLRRGLLAEIVAADLACHMLHLAAANIAAAGLSESIHIVRVDCKQLPESVQTFDAVMSNSIVHHIPQPLQVMKQCWRILRPGGLLFIRDLLRPPTYEQLDWLVQTYAGTANEHGQQMFRASLHAALTLEEVVELAKALNLPESSVRATSDRHWTLATIKKDRPGNDPLELRQ